MSDTLEYEPKAMYRGIGVSLFLSLIAISLMVVGQPFVFIPGAYRMLASFGYFEWIRSGAVTGPSIQLGVVVLSRAVFWIGILVALAGMFYPRDGRRRVPRILLLFVMCVACVSYILSPMIGAVISAWGSTSGW